VRTTALERKTPGSSARTRSGGSSSTGSSCAAAYGSSSAGRAFPVPHSLAFGTSSWGTQVTSASCPRATTRRGQARRIDKVLTHVSCRLWLPQRPRRRRRRCSSPRALRRPRASRAAWPASRAAPWQPAEQAGRGPPPAAPPPHAPPPARWQPRRWPSGPYAVGALHERPGVQLRGRSPCATALRDSGCAPDAQTRRRRAGPTRPERPACASAPPPALPGRAGAGLGAAPRPCGCPAPPPARVPGRAARRRPRVPTTAQSALPGATQARARLPPGTFCGMHPCGHATGGCGARVHALQQGRRLGPHQTRPGDVAADDVPQRAAQLVHIAAGRRCVGGRARLVRVLRRAAALTRARLPTGCNRCCQASEESSQRCQGCVRVLPRSPLAGVSDRHFNACITLNRSHNKTLTGAPGAPRDRAAGSGAPCSAQACAALNKCAPSLRCAATATA